MRTAYLGTSDFAATVLGRLAESEHRPALVVTPPDSRKGRGRRKGPPAAAEAARDLGIEVHQTESVNDAASVDALRALAPEVVAVCAFGQLIKPPLLDEHLMLNVHPSLIPRWRGAAPIERSIMAGDEHTGMTIMRVTEGLDSGPVAVQQELPLPGDAYWDQVSGALAELGGSTLVAALDRLAAGELEFREQDEATATYAEKIAPEERRLDPARPAVELARTVRALNPHIGTHVEIDGGGRLGVRRARVAPGGGPPQGAFVPMDGSLLLGTAEGVLELESIQPPGGRAMPATDFLRGHDAPSRAASA